MWGVPRAPAGVARCRRSLRPAACRGLCWVPGPSPSRASSPHLAWASAPGCGSAGGLRARAVGASYAPASERHLLSLLLTPRSSPLCDGAPSGQKQTNAPHYRPQDAISFQTRSAFTLAVSLSTREVSDRCAGDHADQAGPAGSVLPKSGPLSPGDSSEGGQSSGGAPGVHRCPSAGKPPP